MYGHKLYSLLPLPVLAHDKYNLSYVASKGYCSLPNNSVFVLNLYLLGHSSLYLTLSSSIGIQVKTYRCSNNHLHTLFDLLKEQPLFEESHLADTSAAFRWHEA